MKRLFAIALLTLATSAMAEGLPETPPPGELSADLGLAFVNEPLFAGARRRTTDPFPVVAFKYGTRLQGSLDDGLRWTAFDLDVVKLGPVVEYRQADRLRRAIGFPGMRDAVETGGFVEIATPVVDLEGRVRHALTGYSGWSADLAADIGGALGPRLVLGGEARLSYAGYQFVRREYGPDARRPADGDRDDARRPYYFTAGGQAQAAYHLTRRLDLRASISLDRLLDTVRAPQIRDRVIRQFATSISIHFGPRTL